MVPPQFARPGSARRAGGLTFWSRLTGANRRNLGSRSRVACLRRDRSRRSAVQPRTREGLRRRVVIALAPSATRWGRSVPGTCLRQRVPPTVHAGTVAAQATCVMDIGLNEAARGLERIATPHRPRRLNPAILRRTPARPLPSPCPGRSLVRGSRGPCVEEFPETTIRRPIACGGYRPGEGEHAS